MNIVVCLEYLSLLIMVHMSKSFSPSLPPSLPPPPPPPPPLPPLSLSHSPLSTLSLLLPSLSLSSLPSRSLLGDGAETEDHPLLHGAHCPTSAAEGWGWVGAQVQQILAEDARMWYVWCNQGQRLVSKSTCILLQRTCTLHICASVGTCTCTFTWGQIEPIYWSSNLSWDYIEGVCSVWSIIIDNSIIITPQGVK